MDNKVILEKQDLRYLSWSKYRNSSGTAGSYLKAYTKVGSKKYYYKLSNYDSIEGIIGFECINEIIVDRLLTLLDIDHLHYQLIHADILVNEKEIETYLCVSQDFKEINEDKIPLDLYYELEHFKGEDNLSFVINKGWEEYFYKMFVIDYLILNRDRHGANVEVLRDRKKHSLRLSPYFDHGLSLLFSCHSQKDIEKFNVMDDLRVNNYLGSKSTLENLNLIPNAKLPKIRALKDEDKDFIFYDLWQTIDKNLIEKTWQLLKKRAEYYEDFCDRRKTR